MSPTLCRVYIGGLHGKTRERDVEKFFNKYGRLREILLKNGYGFVEFDDERDAEDACHDLDGKELLGERLRVEMARGSRRRGAGGGGDFRGGRFSGGRFGSGGGGGGGRDSGRRRNERFGPPTRTDYRLYVENLSSTTSWQDLKDIMRKGGEVTFADKQGQRGGIVEFASKSEMKAALKKCDGMEVDGKRIRVTEERRSRSASRDRDSRSRTRTRSRSRSVSRSRSRTRSRTPANKGSSGAKDAKKDSGAKKSRSRSVSRSRSRSVSRSRTRS